MALALKPKAERTQAEPVAKPRGHGHWWLVRGPTSRLSCGGDNLPVTWFDGDGEHHRDGGRWWTPMRSLALWSWTADAEHDIRMHLGPESERAKLLEFRLRAKWERKVKTDAQVLGIPVDPEALRLPNPLPERASAWLARSLENGAELTEMAQAACLRSPNEWAILRMMVCRNASWLLRAVALGVIAEPPEVDGQPILPVILRPTDDDERMRRAEIIASEVMGEACQACPT